MAERHRETESVWDKDRVAERCRGTESVWDKVGVAEEMPSARTRQYNNNKIKHPRLDISSLSLKFSCPDSVVRGVWKHQKEGKSSICGAIAVCFTSD